MNQERFVARHQELWTRLESWLELSIVKAVDGSPAASQVPVDTDFPHLFRQICHHLALARSRFYSQQLIARLSRLVLRAHQRLYGSRRDLRRAIVFYLAAGFPVLVRRQWRLVGLSALLFYGPLLAMIMLVQLYPQSVYTLMEPEQVQAFEGMYTPRIEGRVDQDREGRSDFLMFGYYIRNNTGIGFQTFAGGLFMGLGSVFFLVFNGLLIGTIAGYLIHIGYQLPFWSFTIGHSAMELNAIVLSGAAGLRLGAALIRPGRMGRMRALREQGRVAVQMLYGAALMFLSAAFIEAYWSSIDGLPLELKFAVGGLLWLMVIGYFGWVGRGRGA
ncbi:MAG: stage II sporulation protein M [Pseudomonadota bacterium]